MRDVYESAYLTVMTITLKTIMLDDPFTDTDTPLHPSSLETSITKVIHLLIQSPSNGRESHSR